MNKGFPLAGRDGLVNHCRILALAKKLGKRMNLGHLGFPRYENIGAISTILNIDGPRNARGRRAVRLTFGGQPVCFPRFIDEGRLAQLVRARASHARGHWFNSSNAHHPPNHRKHWSK